jgi:hypothetical protein
MTRMVNFVGSWMNSPCTRTMPFMCRRAGHVALALADSSHAAGGRGVTRWQHSCQRRAPDPGLAMDV